MESSVDGKWNKSSRENNMTMPLITIALPTYNNERTIRKAIDSCLSQSDLHDCEILVVNNSSQDSTGEILNSYEGQIRVINNDKTVSLFENHNIALRHSFGRYVVFCHSDDELYPDAIKILKNELNRMGNPSKIILWGHSHFRDFSGLLKMSGFKIGEAFSGQYAVLPFLYGGLTPSGTCYSRDLIEIGGFLSVSNKLAPSDATSMINAAMCGFNFKMIGMIVFKRKDASTLTTTLKLDDAYRGYLNAFENLFNLVGSDEIIGMLQASTLLANPPLEFYRFAVKSNPRFVFKRIIVSLVKKPSLLTNKSFYNVLFLSIFSLFIGR